MKAQIELYSNLLRELEMDIGTRDLTELFLEALALSIKNLKVNSPEAFLEQFRGLYEVVSNTEPKFGILNYQFARLANYSQDVVCKDKKCVKKWKHMVIKRLEQMIREERDKKVNIVKNAEKIEVDGKTILIHDHSHTVQDALVHYKNMGKKFKVIIAEQNFNKTHDNIERMHDAGIPFQVIPSYMLSHVHDQIDMVFFGAVTLKSTMNFVMSPGTHGIISEFHVIDVPVYMFIDTAKFSLWKSKKKVGVFMHKHERTHYNKPITYERIKYSHDRVPHKLFKKIVTNEGVFTPVALKKLFDEKMKKYSFEK
ncbi:hypothetical protein KJ632_03800 [Patescibacteria group bacterium]|nr:hypothetical protein [Patescibacteria group bacterium]